MKGQNEKLNAELLAVCTRDSVDFAHAEELLRQGAEPLGRITLNDSDNNLYDEIVDYWFRNDETPEELYLITELFLRYGMDISRPAIPYDEGNIINPLWMLAFPSNECVLRTLKLLLDHGLSAEDAAECWGHAISDFLHVGGMLSDESEYEDFYDYIRKVMLIASYPHVLNADEKLRKHIWYDHNDYDLTHFRRWEDFRFEIDTSYCGREPEVYKSIVTIIEKESSSAVWRFGVCITPEEIIKKENNVKIICGCLSEVPPDWEKAKSLLGKGNYTKTELAKIALKFADECFDEEIVDEDDENDIYPVANRHSEYLYDVIKLLLEFGLDPNAEIDNDNILQSVKFIKNEYIAADTTKLLLEKGGDIALLVEGYNVFRDLDFDVIFDAVNQRDRRRYDSLVHVWLVWIGFGATIKDGKAPLEVFQDLRTGKPFDLSELKNHRNFTFGITNVPSNGEDWTLHIFDKRTMWEVARI